MKLIVLEGNSETGKTTTLGMVYDLLTKGMTPFPAKTLLGGDPNDFECIVNYNGQQIAFYTMGDYSNYLSNAITRYYSQGCDIFICALSTNTSKINANKKINRYNGHRISKTLASLSLTELQANQYDANIIFGMI